VDRGHREQAIDCIIYSYYLKIYLATEQLQTFVTVTEDID